MPMPSKWSLPFKFSDRNFVWFAVSHVRTTFRGHLATEVQCPRLSDMHKVEFGDPYLAIVTLTF